MKSVVNIVLFVLVLCLQASAQQTSFQDSLLDRLTGRWVLRGTIEGKATTHDVVASWVLAHQYLQLHEISREKNADSTAVYEALVTIGWDAPAKQYACLWLDVTGGGGLSAQAIGHGRREGDRIAFLFKGGDGSLFHTTFARGGSADDWQWVMDGEENGKLQPFARLTLTRQ